MRNACTDLLREKVQDDVDSAILHNDELPETVLSTLRCRLSDAGNNLATLEDEIARIESVLDALRSQRSRDMTRIQSYREALAPHRKLPSELLGEIFAYATPMILLPTKEYMREAPWNITHVCSKWRNIALATPAIWDDISLVHNVPNTIYNRSTPSPVRSVLLHSGHSFIVFNIHIAAPTFLGYGGGPSRYRNSTVSTVIIPHKNHVNEVSVTFSLYWDQVHQRSRNSTVVSAITHAGSLTLLHIDVPVPASDVEAIIGHAQSLDTLHLPNGNPFAISTLAKMSFGHLPKLENLSCMLTSDIQDAFFDMLESRRALTCTDISTVNFYILPEGLNRNVEREENLKNHGWKITVYTST